MTLWKEEYHETVTTVNDKHRPAVKQFSSKNDFKISDYETPHELVNIQNFQFREVNTNENEKVKRQALSLKERERKKK